MAAIISGKKLKIAVFGTGYWASLQIPSWMAIGAEITAVWNRTHEKAIHMAETFGIPNVYHTPEEAFENADFDIADIITEAEGHFPLVMMAAKYKKAVITQKPMAQTYEECVRMCEECEKAGVWFAVHENFRYRYSLSRVKRMLDENVLGRVIWAHIRMRSLSRKRFEESPNLLKYDSPALEDMGPHIFDVAQNFFGEVVSVYCRQVSTVPDLGALDVALAALEMKSGAIVQCEISIGQPPNIFICGEKGTLILDSANNIVINRGAGEERLPAPQMVKPDYIPQKSWDYHGGEGMNSIRACLEDLSRAYLSGKSADTCGAKYLKTMELVFQAMASNRQNSVIALK